jgi:hypothetical protein
MSANIFISFASQDTKIAGTICSAIESRGFRCWISSRDILPGENFQSAIVRAIRSSRIMLLVFTANSNRSEEMTKELALASQQKLMVVPLRVEDVAPSDAFAYEFATRQWIDLFSDWEQSMNQLCTRIGAALASEPTSNEPIVLGKSAADITAPAPVPAAARPTPAPLPSAAMASKPAAAARTVKAATAGPGKSAPPAARKRMLMVAAGVVALLAGAAVAIPTLMGKRPAAAPATAAAPVPQIVAPQADVKAEATVDAQAGAGPAGPGTPPQTVVAVAPVTPSEPAQPATAAPAAPEAAASAAETPKPAVRKKRAAPRSSNVPY